MITSRDGPSRRHIQGSKLAKRLPSVKYSLLQYSKIENFTKFFFSKKIHTQKNGNGDTSEIVNIFVAVEGVLSQNIKKIEGGKKLYFRKKISQCRKKLKGDPLGFSNIHSVAKQQKKLKGGPFGKKISGKKVSQCRKKLEGGTLWSPLVWYGTRENRKTVWYAGKLR